MKRVFVDTAFYVAAANPRDALHDEVVRFAQSPRVGYWTTEFVLVEGANFLRVGFRRTAFTRLLASLRSDQSTTIVPASATLFQRGVDFFSGRGDKLWSLTDCTSFIVMQEQNISEALTADHHFAQAGFRTLLAPGP